MYLSEVTDAPIAGSTLGVKVIILRAKSEAEFEDAFSPLAKQRILASRLTLYDCVRLISGDLLLLPV
jgi:hypothetical protein